MVVGFKKGKLAAGSTVKKIVITGPESTGKSVLSRQLAEEYNCELVPEYAREYIENITHKYTFQDVQNIARHQLVQEKQAVSHAKNEMIIFDTWFIITKVWFDVVFGKCPEWLINHINRTQIDLFIICDYDLPWIPDPVRENGGEQRKILFERYCEEIKLFGFNYKIVSGMGDDRKNNAIKLVSSIL